MIISKQVKLALYGFLLFSFFYTEGRCVWSDEVDAYVGSRHGVIRDTRSCLKRPCVPFQEILFILDFIEAGKTKHGGQILALSPHTADLLIDVCDIVNLQHPEFKKRYDIFIEQWVGAVQLPFSLFTFDRIAQVLHYRTDLFDVTEGSAYSKMIKKIIEDELPILRTVFGLIHDLELLHRGDPLADPNQKAKAQEIKGLLDQATSLSGRDKAAAHKEIRAKAPGAQIRGIYALSAMGHDYLTLGRIGQEVEVIMAIPQITHTEQREAFLAGMIQLGELATNKNLSLFMRQKMPTIPWNQLVHCRDAIEHQDEHGFQGFFENLVKGSDPSINFTAWKAELETLKERVSAARETIWGKDPRAVFQGWLQNEVDGIPVYGVIAQNPQSPSIEKSVKKIFRQTPLFKADSQVWARVTNGQTGVTYTLLRTLHDNMQELEALIPTMTDAVQSVKFLEGYKRVEEYLWGRIGRESIHLNDREKDALISGAKDNLGTPDIARFCLALLTMDQSYMTGESGNLFVHASVVSRFNSVPLLPVFKRFRGEMLVTRLVCSKLPFDNSKDLDQPARKELSITMFNRTTTHLHELAHNPDFSARMVQEAFTLPVKFAFYKKLLVDRRLKALAKEIGQLHATYSTKDEYGYANLTEEGVKKLVKKLAKKKNRKTLKKLKHPSAADPEFMEFGKTSMSHFYSAAHQVHLPEAIKKNPARYLASVYSLSVGMGALKEWVLREAVIPVAEAKMVEELREERNFIAHGDIFRRMNGINLADSQLHLLAGHLECCGSLDFVQRQ